MELRLFPLHTVLFPGMALPLNVFEPRYLQLVDECTRDDEPFGVALIREGPEVGGFAVPYDVGTTARIEVAEPGMLNRVSLLARGEQRFRITELHHDRPYLWADAELMVEPSAAAPDELTERARDQLSAFAQLRSRARGEYERDPGDEQPDGAAALADAICATGAGTADERQRLLETLDPRERLARAVEMFEEVLELLRRRVDEAAVQRWNEPGGLN
ncbi:MAG: LON peptidase substrate-binding domain-containing protein [Chloroflexi bacterium]|nr:LON peptidase substrate-binding domain-containing protein [Chloroflexota bacterium]